MAELIHGVKFGCRVELVRPFCRLVLERLPAADWPTCVAPVPLHPQRLRSRGYDQASLLAGAVARALGVPRRATLLQRIVDTLPAARMGATARRGGLDGAFALSRLQDLQGTRILLVDDVRTTGATLDAAAAPLVAAGAEVRCHTLAATPLGV